MQDAAQNFTVYKTWKAACPRQAILIDQTDPMMRINQDNTVHGPKSISMSITVATAMSGLLITALQGILQFTERPHLFQSFIHTVTKNPMKNL